VLDVVLDGRLVFSKHQSGYKCDAAEAVRLVKAAVGSGAE
jgi:hypothetical protein